MYLEWNPGLVSLSMDPDYEEGLEVAEESRCYIVGQTGHRSYIMYHGTTMEVAQKIKRSRFKRSASGMLGPGVYVSRSKEKAKRYPHQPRPGEKLAIMKLKVRVGKVKRIDRQGHPLQYTWHQHGYDTAWVPPNCGMTPSGLEEDCVWDPDRIEVLDVWENKRRC